MRVEPGTYTVRLRAGGRTHEKPLVVREDPRIDLPADERRAWRDAQRTAGELWLRAVKVAAALASSTASAEDRRLSADVRDRLRGLYGDIDDYTGRPTADQIAEMSYYRSVVERLGG
jgi:hypothetical protein